MTAPSGPAQILDGKAAAAALTEQLRGRLAALAGPPPRLVLVSVGDLQAGTESYPASKQRHAGSLGIDAEHLRLAGSLTATAVQDRIRQLAEEPAVHAVLVQLPVPGHLDGRTQANLVPLDKDIDGLSDASLGRLAAGSPVHVPPTPLGVLRLLAHYDICPAGRRVVVVGRSTLVGIPQALLLLLRGVDATDTVAHSGTPDLAEPTRSAHLLISAPGVPGLITARHVRAGAVVVDVGLTRTKQGIRGDVRREEVAPGVAGALTPMPCGTGPMTVAALMENVTRAARGAGRGAPAVRPGRSAAVDRRDTAVAGALADPPQRVGAVLPALASPRWRFPLVHVTGTNGKNSTCAMAAALLSTAGTGWVCSPARTCCGRSSGCVWTGWRSTPAGGARSRRRCTRWRADSGSSSATSSRPPLRRWSSSPLSGWTVLWSRSASAPSVTRQT